MVAASQFEDCIAVTEKLLLKRVPKISPILHPVEISLDLIFSSAGACSVSDLAATAGVGTRQLELFYKKFVGLSPKFYARVVRFSKIFLLIQEDKPNWAEIAHLSGYFDQAHFIKNFKAFTGEEPSRYGFDKEDLANFFLMKKK
jgi:AraC-like DNA-binding protein